MKTFRSTITLALIFSLELSTSVSCSNLPLLTHDACEYARKVCFYADQICALVQDTTVTREKLISFADSMQVQAAALKSVVLK
jgi:hypothetical protein